MIYSIKDVSTMSGLSIYTIRFYDKEGLLPFVSKNKSGHREFTQSDLNLIQMICCLKNTGMQIKDIRKYINYCMEGAINIEHRKKLLIEHREKTKAQIEALQNNLTLINSKIETYTSPNAVEIINAQRKYVEEEKRANLVRNRYTKQEDKMKMN